MLFTQLNLQQSGEEKLKVSSQGGAPGDQEELAQQPVIPLGTVYIWDRAWACSEGVVSY